MRPVTDGAATAARDDADVGSPRRQGATDDRVPLDVSRPRSRCQEDDAATVAGPDRPEAARRKLFRREPDLAETGVEALASQGRELHRCPPGRVTKGRPDTIRPIPDQKPKPYAQWQMATTFAASIGETCDSFATLRATTAAPPR